MNQISKASFFIGILKHYSNHSPVFLLRVCIAFFRYKIFKDIFNKSYVITLLIDSIRKKMWKSGVSPDLRKLHDILDIYRSDDYLSPSSEEMIALIPIGRAGSMFLESLFDGHPNIFKLPGILFGRFFSLKPPLSRGASISDWLFKNFPELEDLSVLKKLPYSHNPKIGYPDFGVGSVQLLQKYNIRSVFDDLYRSHGGIRSASLFVSMTQAWEYSFGTKEKDSYDSSSKLFCHIHMPYDLEYFNFISAFPNLKVLHIVRNPLQGFESMMSLCVASRIGEISSDVIFFDYVSCVDHFIGALDIAACNPLSCVVSTVAVRLEDIKLNTDQTLIKVANWMGVKFHPCMLQETIGGYQFSPPSTQGTKGFDSQNIKIKVGHFFSDHDQRVINLLTYPIAVNYGYREHDAEYLKSEVNWYKPIIYEPLDFEKKILTDLAKMRFQGDIDAPRRRFISIAKRCIKSLEQYGTYPAMVPWLN